MDLDFAVNWSGQYDLTKDWASWDLSVGQDSSLDALMVTLKAEIKNRLQTRADFRASRTNGFMSFLTTQHNSHLNASHQAAANTLWCIRFSVEMITKDQTGVEKKISLDWRRVSEFPDLTSDMESLLHKQLRLEVKLRIQELTDINQLGLQHDVNLDRFIYPQRQAIEYFMAGTVHKGEIGHYDLLETVQYETPTERKNVILAQHKQIDDDTMSNMFRVTGSWQLGDPKGKWFRIGSTTGGGVSYSMPYLSSNNTLVTQTYQINGQNPSLQTLRAKIAKDRSKQNPRVIPRLPFLSFQQFAEQVDPTDYQYKLEDVIDCTVIVRVVYRTTTRNLTEAEKKRPRNMVIPVENHTTFEDLDIAMWNWSTLNPDDRIANGLHVNNTIRKWWIMQDDESNEMRKMYRAQDNDLVMRYIKNASVRLKEVVMYAECHMFDLGAAPNFLMEGI